VNRVGASEWSDLSRSAQADTAPGRVQNIRMKDRGDGTITVAWDKPTTTTSRILDYTITWPGGSATVPGDVTEYPAAGLNNNEKYIFTVKAQNRVNYSLPRSSSEMQPLGTPLPPGAPTVTDLEAGANQTDLRITWPAVLPEGPGPTVYTVSYTNGSTSGAVPGCQKLASLSCTHGGVPYDGLTYTYTVVAANQPLNEPANRSAPSAGTTIEAVGRPAAWGAFEVVPTGANQEAEVRYTVPDSRGTTSRVEILVGGQLNRAFNQQTGFNAARVTTPSNQQPYQVQLRVCNEDAPAGCTLSAVQNVQTYGRLDGMLNDIGAPTVYGRDLTWTITGSTNGDPAELAIRINGGPEQVVTLNTVGAFSHPFSATAGDYDVVMRIEVRLRDPAPSRGEAYQSRADTSGPPPPPSVRIGKAACNDTEGSTAPDCQQNSGQPACTAASCAFVVLQVSGLRLGESVSCEVDNSGVPDWDSDRDWRYWEDGDHQIPYYYESGTTTALCTWRDQAFLATPNTW
jgi:hypothetical protein